LIVNALMAQLSAVETAQLLRLPGAAPARDLAFRLQPGYAPRAGILSTAASSGEGTTADVRGILFSDRDTDGVYSDREPGLGGRGVRQALVRESQGQPRQFARCSHEKSLPVAEAPGHSTRTAPDAAASGRQKPAVTPAAPARRARARRR
jgi:hypothetical protein